MLEIKKESYANNWEELNKGELVYFKDMGKQGLVGIVVSDEKYDDDEYVYYDVLFRGYNAEIIPIYEEEKFELIHSGNMGKFYQQLFDYGDLKHYESIAIKKRIPLGANFKNMLKNAKKYEKRRNQMSNIIEIKKDVYIIQKKENIILERGDKIEILENVKYTCLDCGYELGDAPDNYICSQCGSEMKPMAESQKPKRKKESYFIGTVRDNPRFLNKELGEAEEIKIDKIIKDLQGNFSGSNDDQMKAVQLLKGLATSDDPKSNEFMKKLDKAATEISKEVLGEKE